MLVIASSREEMYRALPTKAQKGLAVLSTLPAITEDLAGLLTPDSESVIAAGLTSGVLTQHGHVFEMHPLLRAVLQAET